MNDTTPDIPDELAVPIDTICALIALARDLQGKDISTLLDDESPDPDELEANILESRGVDPAALEFRTLIDDLPEDAQIDLVALMWLGREDEGDWTELRALAEQERSSETWSYLAGTPLVADYLADGLAILGRDCVEEESQRV